MIQNSKFFNCFFKDLVEDATLFDVQGQVILCSREEHTSKHWRDFIPHTLNQSFEHAFQWCIEVNSSRSVQVPIVEGAEMRWIQYRLSYYHDGDTEGVSMIALDISHQVETLDELEKLSRSIEQTPTMIVMTDLNGKIEYVNPSYEKVYQLPLSELVGGTPAQLKEDHIDLWKSLTQGQPWSGEIQVERPSGGEGFERLKAFCIQNELGEITQFCLIAEDVTREHHLQGQLIQSQRLEAIGTLAGGVAHDFNNILMIISGFAEMGIRHLDPEHRSLKSFKTILEATERASRMTNSLLSFSRRQDIHPESFYISEYVEGLIPLWRRLIPSTIEINFKALSDDVEINADKVHLEQILMNLVVNARDAIQEVEDIQGRIQLSIESRDQEIVILCRDNGLGIPDEIKQKIFEPFYTTKEKGKGTGLGLSTVIGLVKQHHGDLKIHSPSEGGTEFRVILPIAFKDKSTSTKEMKKNLRSKNGKILVVDDEKQIRQFFTSLLEDMGYEVTQAEDGAEAKRICDKEDFGIILTDMNMPICNGLGFLNKIEGYPADVIVISGFIREFEEISEEVKSSFKSIQFLKKPLSAHTLIKTLDPL